MPVYVVGRVDMVGLRGGDDVGYGNCDMMGKEGRYLNVVLD